MAAAGKVKRPPPARPQASARWRHLLNETLTRVAIILLDSVTVFILLASLMAIEHALPLFGFDDDFAKLFQWVHQHIVLATYLVLAYLGVRQLVRGR